MTYYTDWDGWFNTVVEQKRRVLTILDGELTSHNMEELDEDQREWFRWFCNEIETALFSLPEE